MSKKASSPLLTETELELMNHIWALGKCSVRDILKQLPESRNMAYTSASTIVRILEQKGIVESHKEGKAHIYTAKLKKNEYEKTTLKHVIKNVFSGTPSQLVKRLVNDEKLSKAEREEIRRIISEDL